MRSLWEPYGNIMGTLCFVFASFVFASFVFVFLSLCLGSTSPRGPGPGPRGAPRGRTRRADERTDVRVRTGAKEIFSLENLPRFRPSKVY